MVINNCSQQKKALRFEVPFRQGGRDAYPLISLILAFLPVSPLK